MIHPLRPGLTTATITVLLSGAATLTTPGAHADGDVNTLIPNNHRLNDSVVANVYTIQREAGCTGDVNPNPQLQLAAQWHTLDVLNNRNLDGEAGSDGSTPQGRAGAAGYRGKVAETVAINPSLAISGMDILNQWYYDPVDKAIMSDCANTQMGVWSENSLDRTVVVAVYGKPQQPPPQPPAPPGAIDVRSNQPNPLDPFPDYDGSGELEYGIGWLPQILHGVYPPPAIPPQ
jgi:hypothetical protein